MAVGCKWVFSIKQKSDSFVDRLKTRLVAKGFAQTFEVDYFDIFSPGSIVELNSSYDFNCYKL